MGVDFVIYENGGSKLLVQEMCTSQWLYLCKSKIKGLPFILLWLNFYL